MSFFLQISATFRLIILLCFVWSKCVICCDKEENLTYQGITNIIIIIIIIIISIIGNININMIIITIIIVIVIIIIEKIKTIEGYNWNYKNFDKKSQWKQ